MGIKLKPIHQQVIVITGASRGIGLATAHQAASRGARVVIASRDSADIQSAADDIIAGGGRALPIVADVGDQGAMDALAELAVQEYGRIDTWVNNAGVSIHGRIEDTPLDEATHLFRTNYWGVVHGSLAALPHLKKQGGALINVGSAPSETAMPFQAHYAASKHAVKGFTDTLRAELQNENAPVSVTLIQPAAIGTASTQHARNHTGADQAPAPPAYPHETVAEAILECAVSPHRELRVDGSAGNYTVIEMPAPVQGDRIKERTSFDGSMTTKVALNPIGTVIGAAALGLGIAAVLRSRSD
jgi:NADP-dependent 3-hydroxy acid dehydrogenase YdfG